MSANANIWYGEEHELISVGKKYKDRLLITRPIHCAGEPGSGWKFEVVTGSDDINLVGEIVTVVKPSDREAYITSLFLPTLFTSGLNGGERINATRLEYLYYLQFIYNSRSQILANWNELKISASKQGELEQSIAQLRLAISGRRTKPIVEAWETNPSLIDRRGRINPGVASAKYTAVATRLEKQVGRELRSEDSMQKRRRFATKLFASLEQDIWDMRNLHRLSPITINREINRRLNRNIFKPTLFASLYCQRVFGEQIGSTNVLPKLIDVFTAEVQLMAVRNLVADIQRGNNTNENLRIIDVMLSIKPNEELYADLFKSIQAKMEEVKRMITIEDEDFEKICSEIKNCIRYRASEDIRHPWYIQSASSY